MIRIALAAAHLIALGIGLGAVWSRARALSSRPLDVAAPRQGDAWHPDGAAAARIRTISYVEATLVIAMVINRHHDDARIRVRLDRRIFWVNG